MRDSILGGREKEMWEYDLNSSFFFFFPLCRILFFKWVGFALKYIFVNLE